jgi:thiosulfate dehydrogenase [quinone] large subunit
MASDRRPAERTLEAELFGRDVTFDYSETWIAYSIVLLRVALGWIFLQAGIEKLLDPSWTAAGYLQNAIADTNPLQGLFVDFAGAAWVDPLVVYGQLLIGIALVVGALVRWAAFWGFVMMLLFWLSSLQDGLLAGLPVEHGYVVNSDVVYMLLLFGLGAVGAGRILGVDRWLEDTSVVENNPWLRILLG